MNRLFLIFVVIGAGWYVWWRFRKGFRAVAEAFRDEPPKTLQRKATPPPKEPEKPEKPGPRTVTLEKDPVTGVYRPPKA